MPINTGFLFINKPKGITSYSCIAHIKKILKQKIKIGHAGTLDPFATGLLIIALGRQATRLISHFMTLDKTYTALGKLGELTDTLDYTGTIVKTDEISLTAEQINEAIKSMGSIYEQTPPLYSALKYQSTPLYKLARNKSMDVASLEQIVQTKTRKVQLHQLELLAFNFPFFSIRAHVSHGTYIRSLVNDIAHRAGSCATTYELERSTIGPFLLSNAVDIKSINTIEDIEKHLLAIESIDFEALK